MALVRRNYKVLSEVRVAIHQEKAMRLGLPDKGNYSLAIVRKNDKRVPSAAFVLRAFKVPSLQFIFSHGD